MSRKWKYYVVVYRGGEQHWIEDEFGHMLNYDEHNGVEVYDCGSGAFKHYAVAVYNGLQSYHYYAVELTVN